MHRSGVIPGDFPILMRLACGGCLLLAAGLAGGCGGAPEPIESYTVVHLPATHQIDAAIVSGPEDTWFFKRTSDLQVVPQPDDAFSAWVEAVTWPEGEAAPKWGVPEGWRETAPPDRLSLAAMDTGQEGVQVTITRLPNNDRIAAEEYLLLNVNRWRRQLDLPAWDAQQMREESQALPYRDGLLVSFRGRIPRPPEDSGDDVAAAPPMGGALSAPTTPPPPAEPQVTYATPEGWSPAPSTGFSAVSLQKVEGDKKISVTVTAAGGDLAANVNRWRGQLGLPPQSLADIESSAIKTPVGGDAASLFELSNEEEAIYGVILPRDGVTWFVKMTGDAALAQQQRANYLQFLESLRFDASPGE